MQENQKDVYAPFSSLRLYLTGFIMGAADLIPGVSGGTIAFIMGIYEALLSAIKSVNVKFISALTRFKFKDACRMLPWRFMIALGAGIGTAILGMAKLMHYLLENEQVYLFSFFFGLVLASIITISRDVKWNIGALVSLVLGTIAAYIIVGLVPTEMPHTPLHLFLSGIVAIMAMILPGISGSFILLILGQYKYVLEAVTRFDVLTVMPVALGAVIGITGFARILSWLLNRYNSVTVAALVGFMIGSLRKVWPWKEAHSIDCAGVCGDKAFMQEINTLPATLNNEVYFACFLALCGFVLLVYITYLANKKAK